MRRPPGACMGSRAPLQVPAPPAKPPWRRILYEQQPYPDSYLPQEEWSRAVYVSEGEEGHALGWLALLVSISPLIQGVNVVFVFLELFWQLEQDVLHPVQLFVWLLMVLGVIHVVLKTTELIQQRRWPFSSTTRARSTKGRGRRRSPRRGRGAFSPSLVVSSIIVLLVLYALSPVLRTLTEATTSDTIYPLSFALFGLHICLAQNTLTSIQAADHSARSHWDNMARHQNPAWDSSLTSASHADDGGPLFSALSLNAAVSASLVLASRLPSNGHVFVLLFLAIFAFALLPMLARKTRRTQPLLIPFCLAAAAVMLARDMHSWAPLCIISLANTFMISVIPLWLRSARRRKVVYVSGTADSIVSVEPLWKVAKPVARRKKRAEL